MSAAFSNRQTLLNTSFWSFIDIDQTFAHSTREMKMKYNASLHSRAGRLRSGEMVTIKVLTHLLCEEMETMRLTRPEDYLFYMSEEMDSLPVKTNRGQLRTMMDQEVSLATYSNYIQRLMAAQIILRKRNTSRVVKQIIGTDGKECKVITIAPNGRGDFILFINKKALTFKHGLKNTPLDAETAQFSAIENQPITDPKTRSLEQPHEGKINTTIIDYNIAEEGVDKSTTDRSAIAEIDRLAHRNEGGKITPSPDRSATHEISTAGKDYLEKFKRDRFLAGQLPQTDLEFYATLLYFQVRSLIYPNYPEHFAKSLEPHAKNLLRLHLTGIDSPLEEAFQTVSRAIQLVHSYINTKSGAFVYGMLTWLRIDDNYHSGTLKTVIDQWIPKEQERLHLRQKENESLVKWQYAVHFSNKLFLEVIRDLRDGFSKGLRTYRTAFSRLDSIAEKYKLPAALKTKIKEQFTNRTYSILKQVEQSGLSQKQSLLINFKDYFK
jgi:hypothetical protein